MKTRVSGVPYEVELVAEYEDTVEHYLQKSDIIAELEKENNQMRAKGYKQFKATDYASYDEMIATLEQENRQMRARMDRLEDELRTANELLTKAHIDLANLRNKTKYYEEND